jgi:hypothetical protein
MADLRPASGGVMSTGAAITLIAVGAILRFALAGSPHGLIRGDDRFFAPDVPGCEEDDF